MSKFAEAHERIAQGVEKGYKTFHYTYSAKEQIEIQNIRRKYVATIEPEDKMAQLRRLDASVTSKATTAALVTGVIGTLIMGLGMSFAMSELSGILGIRQDIGMLISIIIGVVGIVVASLAYPLYNRTIKREREKIAPEILRLSDELMK